jgi:hypothetical protein
MTGQFAAVCSPECLGRMGAWKKTEIVSAIYENLGMIE